MKAARSVGALVLAFFLGACNTTSAPEQQPSVEFDRFLLEMLDPAKQGQSARRVDDKQFRFPADPAAFAGLFPSES